MPLTFSIADGMAAGFIAHAVVKLAQRNQKGMRSSFVLAAISVAYFTLIRNAGLAISQMIESMKNHPQAKNSQGYCKPFFVAVSAELMSSLNHVRLRDSSTASRKPQPVNPDAALKCLLEGNQRFVNGKCQNPRRSLLRLEETAFAQHPFAAVLGCADSRVPAEIIFDQGLGDLFVVRVAGSVGCQTTIESLEFATSVLGTQLIVVVGHSQCGAVAAATKENPLSARIGSIVQEIKPAVARARTRTGDLQENAAIANVQYQVQKLENSIILADLIQKNKLKIVGGYYDLKTGKFSIVSGEIESTESLLSDRNFFAQFAHRYANVT